MPRLKAERYKNEAFSCERCYHRFTSTVSTWVDVSMFPGVKRQIQDREFNRVACTRCGHRQFSTSPFFYEDFVDGLLIGVFPEIKEGHHSLEEEIRQTYTGYPLLEVFYDMAQLWLFLSLHEYYKNNSNRNEIGLGKGEHLIRNLLSIIKTDPSILTVCTTISETFSGNKTNYDLQDIVWRALSIIEGSRPAPGRF